MDDMSNSMSTLSTKVLYGLLPYCLKSAKDECSIHCVKKKNKGLSQGLNYVSSHHIWHPKINIRSST